MWLGTTLETIPPPTQIPIAWRGGAGIGVVPTGSREFVDDARRSLSNEAASRLLELGRDLRPESTGARDFRDTAEIVSKLDLVITVDTSVAHLAGSMGAPTWVLLPAVAPDWRWLYERSDTPWYPSVKLFRQRAAGDWEEVLDRVLKSLNSDQSQPEAHRQMGLSQNSP